MPNHVHLIFYKGLNETRSISTIIGNGKRFLAYEIVKRLEHMDRQDFLAILKNAVSEREKKRGNLHRVFIPSFVSKNCVTPHFILQKINYIHNNPISGKWNLAKVRTDYVHSSAHFYDTDEQGLYEVVDYRDLEYFSESEIV
jgi:REP element-mobilizing transposase RayT